MAAIVERYGRVERLLGRRPDPLIASLPHRLEMAQVGRRLVLLLRHQVALAAEEIDLLIDGDVVVGLDAVVLLPGDVLRVASVALHHGPRPCQGIVGRGDLVVQDVGLVEKEPLLDDRFIVVGGRQAGLIPLARAADVAGLDLERVIAPGAVATDPFPDGVARKGRLAVLGEVASIGVDAARMGGDVLIQDVGRARREQETPDICRGMPIGMQA